jgi:CubicO group peptidase (beta-lactamase class C family)
MRDTTFRAAEVAPERLAPMFERGDDDRAVPTDISDDLHVPADRLTLAGGAGLLSTSRDYVRFVEMLRRGGTLDGVTILQPETVAEMTRNQLPGDLDELDVATFAEVDMSGIGWGYGVSVVTDPQATEWPCSLGEFGWGGYANTAFWVDPVHQVCVVFTTQLIPSGCYPLRAELRGLVTRAQSGL